MPTNRKLRAALLEKKSRQALSRLVQKKIKQLPMSTTEATYVVAHEVGIRIDRYLQPAEVERTRHLAAQLQQSNPVARATKEFNGKERRAPQNGPREVRFPNRNRVTSHMLTATQLSEGVEMASLYPILYVLENSMREVVNRVMKANFGGDWFNTKLVSGKLKTIHQTATSRMATEQSRHAWHQRRGAHAVNYIDLEDLGLIITGHHGVFFPTVLGTDVDWFRHFMKELLPSRNVLCHMNPLEPKNIADVEIKLGRWEELVRNAGSRIPPR